MNSINEKEKKLNIALEELKNLDLTNPELQKNIENLSTKQNQLEIEKTQIEEKYKTLLEEHENLSKKLEDLKNELKALFIYSDKSFPIDLNRKYFRVNFPQGLCKLFTIVDNLPPKCINETILKKFNFLI